MIVTINIIIVISIVKLRILMFFSALSTRLKATQSLQSRETTALGPQINSSLQHIQKSTFLFCSRIARM